MRTRSRYFLVNIEITKESQERERLDMTIVSPERKFPPRVRIEEAVSDKVKDVEFLTVLNIFEFLCREDYESYIGDA